VFLPTGPGCLSDGLRWMVKESLLGRDVFGVSGLHLDCEFEGVSVMARSIPVAVDLKRTVRGARIGSSA
jgi:hypothetical protein